METKKEKMKIAIVYCSKQGTTEKVVRKIAEKSGGNQISIFNLKEDKLPNISSFEGIILGTSIYAGQSSKLMQAFVKKQTDKSVSDINSDNIDRFVQEINK
ncbi:hypothetical protein FACS1894174_07990 [Bacteroidia bacterium]|nr:hypothetical protein FACS1894203_1250 [Bacteroidia bacterium]GHV22830.1 hypothetical protein FACS1894174_07990 [Bacteroidia bacterium]